MEPQVCSRHCADWTICHCFMLKRRAAVRRWRFHAGRVLSGAGFVTRSIDPSAQRRDIASADNDSDLEWAAPADTELRSNLGHPERSRGIPLCFLEAFATGFFDFATLRS